MKTCTKCKQEKEVECFCFKNKNQGTRQSWCRDCRSEQHKKYYPKHALKYKTRAKVLQRKYERRNRTKVLEYLRDHPCIDCGENDVIVLQFDHIDPQTKIANVSNMVNAYSWEKIRSEIKKCEVRCSNCHVRKTSKQFGWYSKLGIEVMAKKIKVECFEKFYLEKILSALIYKVVHHWGFDTIDGDKDLHMLDVFHYLLLQQNSKTYREGTEDNGQAYTVRSEIDYEDKNKLREMIENDLEGTLKNSISAMVMLLEWLEKDHKNQVK